MDVKGKVVLIKSGEPKDDSGTYLISGTMDNSKWSNFRQEYVAKRDVAKEKGAKALLFYYAILYSLSFNRYIMGKSKLQIQFLLILYSIRTILYI